MTGVLVLHRPSGEFHDRSTSSYSDLTVPKEWFSKVVDSRQVIRMLQGERRGGREK